MVVPLSTGVMSAFADISGAVVSDTETLISYVLSLYVTTATYSPQVFVSTADVFTTIVSEFTLEPSSK